MAKKTADNRLAYSAREVCQALGISKSGLYEAIARGDFPPARKLGRRALWAKKAVDAWLAGESLDHMRPSI